MILLIHIYHSKKLHKNLNPVKARRGITGKTRFKNQGTNTPLFFSLHNMLFISGLNAPTGSNEKDEKQTLCGLNERQVDFREDTWKKLHTFFRVGT